jgi:L-asparaginase/Glu-tRNA(Gln) amidotransferase subunit D
LSLAHMINAELAKEEVSGVVVTHGTDTLEETAFFLESTVNSTKPVIVVGAMRPATALSADGPLNLYQAVTLAGSPAGRNRGTMVSESIEPIYRTHFNGIPRSCSTTALAPHSTRQRTTPIP